MDLSRIDLKGDQARRCYYTDEPMPVPSFSELQAFLHEDTAAIRYVVDLLTVAHKRIEQLMERVQRLESKEAQAASTPTSYDVGYEAGVTHLPQGGENEAFEEPLMLYHDGENAYNDEMYPAQEMFDIVDTWTPERICLAALNACHVEVQG